MSTLTMPAFTMPSVGQSVPDQNGVCTDDSLYEIVNGQRVELPPMSILATWLNTCLNGYLWSFVTSKKLGRVVGEGMFILDAARKQQRRPDLAFVSAKTWPLDRPMPTVGDWEVVPDLAVEIVSPNDLFEAVLAKIMEYFTFGVKNVWLVSPGTSTMFVFQSPSNVMMLTRTDELDGGELIPGFRLKLAELFSAV